ncbi:hypothetical protein AA313_de0201902 [Arthrobotrys entomopaga]|nr:hypothetical protein AA313_de0201902 [Arthrobotrys entomopaga]
MDISGCPAARCKCASYLHEEGRHCGKCSCIARIYEWARMKGEDKGISIVDALVSGAVSKNDYRFPEGMTWEEAVVNETSRGKSPSQAEQGTSPIFPPMHPSVYRPNNGKTNPKSRLIIQVNATFPPASFDRPGGNPNWSLKEIVNSRRGTVSDSRIVEYAAKYVFSNGEPACGGVIWHSFDELNFPWGIRLLRLFHRRYFMKPKDGRVDDRSLVEWSGERSEWFNGTDLFKKELEKKAEYQAFREAQEVEAQRTSIAALNLTQMSTSKAPGEDTDMSSAKSTGHDSMAVECATSSDSEMWETYRKANEKAAGFPTYHDEESGRARGDKLNECDKIGNKINNTSGQTLSDRMEIESSSTDSDTGKNTERPKFDKLAWRERMKKATENANQAVIGNELVNDLLTHLKSEQESGQRFDATESSLRGQVGRHRPKPNPKTNSSRETTSRGADLGMIEEEYEDNEVDNADDERETEDLDPLAIKRSRGSAGSIRRDSKRAKFFDRQEPGTETGLKTDDTSRATKDESIDHRDNREENSLPTKPMDSIEAMDENDAPGNVDGWKMWTV